MKKYLMTGMAAIAFCAAFTSCSKDENLYDPKAINEMETAQVYEAYNQAFIATFGQVHPDQNWGFGNNSFTRSYTPYTRTINSNWNGWVSAPVDGDFASAFPSQIEPAGDYYKYQDQVRKNYKLADGKEQTINFWRGNANIYVDGEREITFNNPEDRTPGITFYILPGADVTFKGDFSYNSTNNPAMYVSPRAKVTFAGKMSSNVHIYNRGEIVVKDVTGPYAYGVIYNEGKFTSEKNLAVFNDGAQVVNVGTWTVAEGMNVEGSGHFRNLGGTMTITGLTFVNSNECSWINDAQFITDNYTYHAGSHDVINNCKLTVNEDFTFTVSDGSSLFQIDGGGSVVTNNFYGSGPFKVEMGSLSLFKVTNDCYLDATASGIATNGYGFHGVGSDYAVLQAKNVTNHGNPGHGYVTYGGKLYISAETHFAQGTAGASDGASYILFQNGCSLNNIYASGFKVGKPAITIPVTDCCPGFEGDTPDPTVVRIMAEDLNATAVKAEGDIEDSDWDFNDVVFDVKFDETGTGGTITLICAGGVLPLEVAGVEVHKKFDPSLTPDEKGWYPMINTGRHGAISKPQVSFHIDNADKANKGKGILIQVYKQHSDGQWYPYTLDAKEGQPAAKFAVKNSVNPLLEREHIDYGTGGAFSRAVQDGTWIWF